MKQVLRLLLTLSMCSSLTAMKGPSLSSFGYTGAWLLPVETYNKKDYVILGREAGGKDKGTYDAFGGGRDPQDANHPVSAASREGSEEMISRLTLGIDTKSMLKYLDLPAGNTRTIIATRYKNRKSRHVTYLTQFSTQQISQFLKEFHTARGKTKKYSEREKDLIAVVRLSNLKKAIASSKTNTGIKVWAMVHDKGKVYKKQITLRPVFVKNLRGYAEDRPYTQGKSAKIRFYEV